MYDPATAWPTFMLIKTLTEVVIFQEICKQILMKQSPSGSISIPVQDRRAIFKARGSSVTAPVAAINPQSPPCVLQEERAINTEVVPLV